MLVRKELSCWWKNGFCFIGWECWKALDRDWMRLGASNAKYGIGSGKLSKLKNLDMMNKIYQMAHVIQF